MIQGLSRKANLTWLIMLIRSYYSCESIMVRNAKKNNHNSLWCTIQNMPFAVVATSHQSMGREFWEFCHIEVWYPSWPVHREGTVEPFTIEVEWLLQMGVVWIQQPENCFTTHPILLVLWTSTSQITIALKYRLLCFAWSKSVHFLGLKNWLG
jgi:hypothetical protein